MNLGVRVNYWKRIIPVERGGLMAESYRHAEKKSKGLSLIMGRETIKIPHVVFIFISPKKDKV